MKKIIANLTVFITFIILFVLGLWQLQRLEYKNNIIFTLKSSLNLPTEKLDSDPGKSMFYRNIHLCGHYLKGHSFMVYSKPNYMFVTPFYISEDNILLVARGILGSDQQYNGNENDTKECITGIIMPGEKLPLFMPKNDGSKAKPLLSINIENISNMSGLKIWDSYLLLTKSDNIFDNSLQPLKIPNPNKIYNAHLEYAITWFSLAGIILIMFFWKRYR